MLFSIAEAKAISLTTLPYTTIQVGEFISQQDPPEQPGKITATVISSVESETIKLRAFFPQEAQEVKVSLHNLLGREISVHPTTSVGQGETTFQFDTRNLSNGPYFVVLEALGQRITKKIMLTR